ELREGRSGNRNRVGSAAGVDVRLTGYRRVEHLQSVVALAEINVELAVEPRRDRCLGIRIGVDLKRVVSLFAFQLGLAVNGAVLNVESIVSRAHVYVELC